MDLIQNVIATSKSIIRLSIFIKRNGFSWFNFKKLIIEVIGAVDIVEKNIGVLSSKSKLNLAINTLSTIVDIPFIPKFIERWILAFLINKLHKLLIYSIYAKTLNDTIVSDKYSDETKEFFIDPELKNN